MEYWDFSGVIEEENKVTMDFNESTYLIENINRVKQLNKSLAESSFRYDDLQPNEQDVMYNNFKATYDKAVGASWTKDKFVSRVYGWLFFGDVNGYVAVRPQKSGFYKLVGMAGDVKSIIAGFDELMSNNYPVWGMVDDKILKMAQKKGFKTPPAFLLKLMYKVIPSSVFGGVDFDINSDGSITLKYQDVGDAKKFFIGNDIYFSKIKKDILPTIKDQLKQLPLLARKGIETFLKIF